MRGSFFSTNGSTHNARFASGTTGVHKRKKMILLIFFFVVVCLVSGMWTFRGSSSDTSREREVRERAERDVAEVLETDWVEEERE